MMSSQDADRARFAHHLRPHGKPRHAGLACQEDCRHGGRECWRRPKTEPHL